jgi:hypothetical protein
MDDWVNCRNQRGRLEGRGIYTVSPGQNERLLLGGQLQNMYLFPGLHETTIGEFLLKHPDVLRAAFHTDVFLYEKSLKWIEHDGTVRERTINPDLFIKRPDGHFDIYDLKTALLDRARITKGDRNRRRFVDVVNEGIAQLKNYEWYFTFSKNAEWAQSEFGISVCRPQLTLVVGSWENVDLKEVSEALRSAPENVSIVDYDTMVHIFMGATKAVEPDNGAAVEV